MGEPHQMIELEKLPFDVGTFLANVGVGRKIVKLAPKKLFFSQGDPADSVFYLQNGRAKLTVVSKANKKATILMFSARKFVREGALTAMPKLRLSTTTAITT